MNENIESNRITLKETIYFIERHGNPGHLKFSVNGYHDQSLEEIKSKISILDFEQQTELINQLEKFKNEIASIN